MQGRNSPNFCHFWNVFHSSVSWSITPLYFFSWHCIYFQQKEPIKVHIWWNFTWAVKSLKFCTISLMTLKSIANFKEKLTFGFKYDIGNLVNFHPTTQKSQKFHFVGLFFSRVYKVWVKKIQRSYLSWHGTVMQNLNFLTVRF